jgi:hypothetical protein
LIRGLLQKCPFGLPIPSACRCAGGIAKGTEVIAIQVMSPINLDSEDAEEDLQDNLEVLSQIEDPKQCPYADKIFLNSDKVDCKFNESNINFISNQLPLNGSPEYPSVTIGNSSVPGFGQPPHDYSDNNNRTVYYGIYSLIG